jgi:uncharacterized RDD family membrane protein YckC
MYFWELNRLKFELANKRLSGLSTLAYMACIFFIQSVTWALTYAGGQTSNQWDDIDTGVFFVLLGIGTVYCFYANGGRKGKDFLPRYLSLAWVFGVRYFIIVIAPAGLCLYAIPSFFIQTPDQTQWYDVLFNAVLKLPFYFVLARHISDIALNKVPSEIGSSDFRNQHAEDFDQTTYPSILRRYIASSIDVILVLSALIVFGYMYQGDAGIHLTIGMWIGAFIILSYEPILTSKLCTLGQRITGISIRNSESRGRISFLNAYLRTIIKLLLGIVSFVSIPITRKRRALHDFVARSVVVYAE